MDKKLFARFIVLWFVNSTLIYVAHIIYPSDFVLGTALLSAPAGVVVSGLLLTLLCRLGKTLTNKLKGKVKGRIGLFVYYWVVNGIAIWLIARFAPFTGFGITHFYWAFVLGFVTNVAQWIVRQLFKAAKLI